MKEFKLERHYLLRLDKDEELFSTLENWATKNNIQGGYLKGIGALKDVELGFYHLEQKHYDKVLFPREAELLSLDGNMSFKEGSPFFHIHAVLGNEKFEAFGGHLFSAKVAVTAEIQFIPFDARLDRAMNEEIGLSLLSSCAHAT
ncbi:DUF296 domain-containing protein [bacterium]|nr:DUF296 domain-containing protein [bacterium]